MAMETNEPVDSLLPSCSNIPMPHMAKGICSISVIAAIATGHSTHVEGKIITLLVFSLRSPAAVAAAPLMSV